MINYRILGSILLSALLLGACASKGMKIGQDFHSDINAGTFETKIKGTPRVLLISENSAEVCKKKKKLPSVTLTSKATGEVYDAKVYCDRDAESIIARFRESVDEGKYKISVKSNSSLKRPIKGVALFDPISDERFSDADQGFQGATTLNDGVNEGNVSPGNADRTDWWTLEVPELSRYSMVYHEDTAKPEIKVTIFKLSGGKLQAQRSMRANQAVRMTMEGSYYIKVEGNIYGRNSNYTINLKKLDLYSGGVATNNQSFEVLDKYPLSEHVTEVLVDAGPSDGLKEGGNLKIFDSSSNKFLAACKLLSVAEGMSVCHLPIRVSPATELSARSSL